MLKALIALLLATVACAVAADPLALVGTVTNTTNPKQPVSADALITFDNDGHCILKISPPLYGSGACALKTYDSNTGYTEITSEGALVNITATGTTNGAPMAGSYKVESPSTPEPPQSGTFQFTIVSGPQRALQLSDVLSWDTLNSGDQEFLIVIR